MDFIFAIFAGAIVPLQAGMNAHLRTYLGHPVFAVLVSVAVSTVALLIYIFAARLSWSGFTQANQVPWWAWLGGVFGALLLIATATLAPRLGSLALVACIITGQILCSILLDQFGLIGFKQHGISLGRVAGIGMLSAGVYLVLRY